MLISGCHYRLVIYRKIVRDGHFHRPIVTNFSWVSCDFLRGSSTFFHGQLVAKPQFSWLAVSLL